MHLRVLIEEPLNLIELIHQKFNHACLSVKNPPQENYENFSCTIFFDKILDQHRFFFVGICDVIGLEDIVHRMIQDMVDHIEALYDSLCDPKEILNIKFEIGQEVAMNL